MQAEGAQAAHRGLKRRIDVAVPIAIATLFLIFCYPIPAEAQSPMVQGWLAVNSVCKGNLSDDAKTQKACKRRDELSAKLKRRGCLYQEDGDWWKCPHH